MNMQEIEQQLTRLGAKPESIPKIVEEVNEVILLGLADLMAKQLPEGALDKPPKDLPAFQELLSKHGVQMLSADEIEKFADKTWEDFFQNMSGN